jgi:hypothetical protein
MALILLPTTALTFCRCDGKAMSSCEPSASGLIDLPFTGGFHRPDN